MDHNQLKKMIRTGLSDREIINKLLKGESTGQELQLLDDVLQWRNAKFDSMLYELYTLAYNQDPEEMLPISNMEDWGIAELYAPAWYQDLQDNADYEILNPKEFKDLDTFYEYLSNTYPSEIEEYREQKEDQINQDGITHPYVYQMSENNPYLVRACIMSRNHVLPSVYPYIDYPCIAFTSVPIEFTEWVGIYVALYRDTVIQRYGEFFTTREGLHHLQKFLNSSSYYHQYR